MSLTPEISVDHAEAKTNASDAIARLQRAADTLSAEIEKSGVAKDAKAGAGVASAEPDRAEPAAASESRADFVGVAPSKTADEKPETSETPAVASAKIDNVAPNDKSMAMADRIAAEEQKISVLAGKAAARKAQEANQAKRAGMFSADGWGRAAALVALAVALSSAAFLGLRDGAGVRSAPAVAKAEDAQPAKPTPEQILTAETQDLRRQIHALSQEVQSLRANAQKQADATRAIETHASAAVATLGQTSARLDRIEREATSKLERQATRVDRLERLTADPVITSTVEKNVDAHALPPKPEALRTAERTPSGADYVLRSVRNGVAVVQTRRGMIEVAQGDMIPGVGRVRSIEKIDGRWVVVTRDGVIDAD